MLLRLIHQLLEYKKIIKQLSKELLFKSACENHSKRKKSLDKWLIKTANLKGINKQQLAQNLYKITKEYPISSDAYGSWLSYQASLPQFFEYNEAVFLSLLGEGDQVLEGVNQLVAEVFYKNNQILLVYTDHDQLDFLGQRINPQFKPDWNLDLFFSIDYLGSSVFVRREWYEKLNLEPYTDVHEFLWQIIPLLQAQQIHHLPKIAYSQPIKKSQESTSINLLIAKITKADVQDGLIENSRRLLFGLPKELPLISLLIPTKDQLALLQACIFSILEKTSYPNYEILIIDNQSKEAETLAWLETIKTKSAKVKVIAYNKNFNYSAINNFAVQKAQGSLIGLVNNDIEVINYDWLDEMVMHALRPEIGCVGAKLYYPDGRIQHAGVILGSGGGSGHAHRYYPKDSEGYLGRLKLVQNFTAVTGACLVMRKSLYEAVGGLNERDLPIAWSDIDLCLKIRQLGYRNLWTPYAELYHHESVSRGRDRSKQQRQRYLAEKAYMHRTWNELMYQDPCYNPNLTVIGEGFSLGLPADIGEY